MAASAMPWRSLLQSLDVPPEHKGEVLSYFYSAKWEESQMQTFFEECMNCGGKRALTAGLTGLILGTGGEGGHAQNKRVTIFLNKAKGKEVFLCPTRHKLTPSTFRSLIDSKGFLVPLRDGQFCEGADCVHSFEDLTDGQAYCLHDDSGLIAGKVKALENFNHSEMMASEDELAHSMVVELTANGISKNPIIRNDLRVHCQGTLEEQEFDSLVLDDDKQAFIGSAKHTVHGTSEVEDLLCQAQKLMYRSQSGFPSYEPFRGREIGCCLRIDHIKESSREKVEELCYRKGVAVFQRSGTTLRMRQFKLAIPQSIDPGFINLVLRGMKHL